MADAENGGINWRVRNIDDVVAPSEVTPKVEVANQWLKGPIPLLVSGVIFIIGFVIFAILTVLEGTNSPAFSVLVSIISGAGGLFFGKRMDWNENIGS